MLFFAIIIVIRNPGSLPVCMQTSEFACEHAMAHTCLCVCEHSGKRLLMPACLLTYVLAKLCEYLCECTCVCQ